MNWLYGLTRIWKSFFWPEFHLQKLALSIFNWSDEKRKCYQIWKPKIFNMIRLVDGLMGCPKHYFFIISCKIVCKNPFSLFFFHNSTKIKGFECPTVSFSIYQFNTWTIRRLVDEMIDPANHRIVLKIISDFL